MIKIIPEKLKNMWKVLNNYPHITKIFSLVILTVLMSLPFGMDKMDLFNTDYIPPLLYPFTVLSSKALRNEFHFFYISCFSFFLLPLTFAITIASIFQKKLTDRIVFISTLLTVTLYLSAAVSGAVLLANTARWFQYLSFSVYVAFFTALAFHIILIARGILSIKAQNESYIEYKRLLLEEKEEAKRARKSNKKTPKSKQKQTAAEANSKIDGFRKKILRPFTAPDRKTHIKNKITIAILLTITVILLTFIYTDLKNYKLLLTQNVNTTGKNQAEQVAAIYNFSDGLHAKISAFLEGIKKTNDSSPFPHQRVDIITTDSKTPVYLEQIDSSTQMPSFNVFSYTTEAGSVRAIPADEKQITPDDAAYYIRHFQNERTRNQPIYKPEKNTYLYVYPITFSRKDGQRLVGFSVVTYLKEILDRPYFQAKVFIYSLAAVFFYAAIIMTLFLADFITDPIMLLCGNIRKTTNILTELLSGNAKIDADKLTFEENIKTRDEIKRLSIEIKNIVTLVRGMLPYVSFHTLRNAEKDSSRSATRDLCFLFTDIRGFTNLCENMPPQDVIALLNRYLDLETKIIFKNGGDVDKYVGDEIMAFFSGPRKEIRACKAAMEIREALYKEHEDAVRKGNAAISLGIGINTGSVVFGPVGSETRKDFTSIGDTVNLAARLEGANKQYGSKIIISESVYKNLKGDFICRELDYITVKGKTEAVRIFEVLQATEKITAEKIQDLKELFEQGLYYYRQRKWKIAEKYFLECIEKYNDKPSKVFLERTIHYRISPPEADWKGVFVMTVK